jgi:hypothetical protein
MTQSCLCIASVQVPLMLWVVAVIVVFAVSAYKLRGMQVGSLTAPVTRHDSR